VDGGGVDDRNPSSSAMHLYLFHTSHSEKNGHEKEISKSATSLPYRNKLGIGRYQISGILRVNTIFLGRHASW
jgi:hypothetical protein